MIEEDKNKGEPEDLNRNGIDDAIEPPIRDVTAGTRQLADRLLNNQATDPTLSGGDIDARWEDAESGETRPPPAAQPLPARTTWTRWARRWASPTPATRS